MKKNIILALVLFMGISGIFTACKNYDFGDINEPQYAATATEPASLIAGGALSYGAIAGRLYSNNYAFYVQWMTQGVYDSEQRYANFQGEWAAYYAGPLANVQKALTMLEDTAYTNTSVFVDANGAPVNVHANALIIKAIVFKRITDIYGAIPASEALTEGITNPKYDTQKEVYQQIIDMLKTARDEMDETLPGSKGDIYYGGDVAKMKKLANSLLMEAAIQISKVDEAWAKDVFMEAYDDAAGYITDVSDEAWYTFSSDAGIVSPWSRVRFGDYNISLQFEASLSGDTTTLDVLGNKANVTTDTNTDYRIYAFVEDPTGNGEDYFLTGEEADEYDKPAGYLWDPNLPLPEMTASYTWLNIAEASELGWVTDITAAEAVRNAIEASYMSYYTYWKPLQEKLAGLGVDAGTWSALASAYATKRVAMITPTNALQVIAEEKWKALFPQSWKAWAEWRRTGYPVLHPMPVEKSLNGGVIPTRYRYPSEAINLNNANYLQGVQDLSPAEDQNTSHVWWDID